MVLTVLTVLKVPVLTVQAQGAGRIWRKGLRRGLQWVQTRHPWHLVRRLTEAIHGVCESIHDVRFIPACCTPWRTHGDISR
jgi:hypothetical protein